MEKKRGRGRPEGSIDPDARRDIIRVRVRAGEKLRYERAARACGTDVSGWIRALCDRAISEKRQAE